MPGPRGPFTGLPSRAYSAEGRTPEHRSREAQRAACRSAAGRRSRPPLAAASAESEGPKSPIIRRERAAGFGGDRIVRTAPPLRCNTTSLSFDARRGEAAASELPSSPVFVNRPKVEGKVGKFNIGFRREQLTNHAGTG